MRRWFLLAAAAVFAGALLCSSRPFSGPSLDRLYNDLMRAGWSPTGQVEEDIIALAKQSAVVQKRLDVTTYTLYYLNGKQELNSSYTTFKRQHLWSPEARNVVAPTYLDRRIKRSIPELYTDDSWPLLSMSKSELVRRYGEPSNRRGKELRDMHYLEYWYRVKVKNKVYVNIVTFHYLEEGAIRPFAIWLDVRTAKDAVRWSQSPGVETSLADLPLLASE